MRIRLRLNPHENRKMEGPATKAVLGVLTELESIFGSATPQFHKLEALVTTLVTNANVILKENWKRVRSGETVYQITKWTALGFAALEPVTKPIFTWFWISEPRLERKCEPGNLGVYSKPCR